MIKHAASRWSTLLFVTISIGIFSGLSGLFLVFLLHTTQYLAYEHTFTPIMGNSSFFLVVSSSTALERVIALSLCGLIAGFGWWVVFRYGNPLISITKALKCPRPYMPVKTTLMHVFLQIITVGLGSPLGREVAPRELSAVFACWLTNKIKLHPKESQIMVACAAGAGLAAVYNVPFGGALFTLEVLLKTFHWFALIPAMTTSALAVVIAWIGLGNRSLYHVPDLTLEPSIVILSLVTGPIFGFSAYWFNELTIQAQNKAPRNWKIIPSCLCNFFLIGVFAIYLPALLGNGRSAMQLGLEGSVLGLEAALILLTFRVLIVYTSIRAGAFGGLLTPSLANGALMAVVLGTLWSYLWPNISITAFAIIGAAAFLAAAQKMPITSIIMIIEFTGIDFSFFIPLLFSVAGSMSLFRLCASKRSTNYPTNDKP